MTHVSCPSCCLRFSRGLAPHLADCPLCGGPLDRSVRAAPLLGLRLFDADLIELVASMPVDYGVRHRLYNAALAHFPRVIKSVAWQTYPGHEPCPIPMPSDAVDQWAGRGRDIERRSRRAGIVRAATRLARSDGFPASVLDRRYVGAAGLLHWLGRDDYSYVLDYASSFSELWRVAHGRWRLDASRRDPSTRATVARDVQTSLRS